MASKKPYLREVRDLAKILANLWKIVEVYDEALTKISEFDDSTSNIGMTNTCGQVRLIALEALKKCKES